jgi:hypothetical protein
MAGFHWKPGCRPIALDGISATYRPNHGAQYNILMLRAVGTMCYRACSGGGLVVPTPGGSVHQNLVADAGWRLNTRRLR